LARDLVIPKPKSFFIQRLCDKKEDVYESQRRAPLGRSHDQRVGLPKGVGPYDVRYGVKVFRDCTAGELVNPAKSSKEIESETLKGLDLYIKSHSAYRVGEMYDRKYDWSRFPKDSQFGKETPHDNRGINAKKTLQWLQETQRSKSAPIVSQRVDNFRERTQPQVGKVHDPIKDTLYARIPQDHTFGILIEPDEYGAGDLIHNRAAGHFLRGKDQERGILASIRHHLKKANYHNFHDLTEAFRFYDRDHSGKIDINELRQVCIQFNLPVDKELLETLLAYCDADNDGKINYNEFSNFLNWKDKLPPVTNVQEEDDESKDPELLHKQVDNAVVDSTTSSQMINAIVGGVSTKEWKTNGIPTIRSDLPAPRIRRIGDSTNYGDESDAYGLMNPSIFSNHGVFERDFFKSRSENEIRQIFDSIGFAMTSDAFHEVWQAARELSETGEVSVELFRQMLDEKLAIENEQYNSGNDVKDSRASAGTRPDIYKKIDAKLGKGNDNKRELILTN